MASPTPASEAAQASAGAHPLPEGESLEDALLKQIEYYFSRENLSSDKFLVQHMDADMWVPIDTIAKFPKVEHLTTDQELITRVMAKSTNVIIDRERRVIKPSWKLERKTIILREMPLDATEEQVRGLFGEKHTITEIHNEVNDKNSWWYISFGSEDAALDAMLWVRTQKLNGAEVKARIKPEHLLKTSFTTVYPPAPYAYFGGPYTGVPPPFMYPVPQGQPYWQGQPEAQGQDNQGRRGGRRPPNSTQTSSGAPYKDGKKSGSQAAQSGSDQSGKSGKSRKPKKVEVVQPTNDVVVNPPQMTTQHFPPLGRQRAGSFKTGYTKDFKKFNRDDIVRIIQTMGNVSQNPSEILPVAKDCNLVADAPNTTLEITNIPPATSPTSASPVPTTNNAHPQPEAQNQGKEWPQKEWRTAGKSPSQNSSPSATHNQPAANSTEDKAANDKSGSANNSSKSIPRVPSYADVANGSGNTNPAATPQQP